MKKNTLFRIIYLLCLTFIFVGCNSKGNEKEINYKPDQETEEINILRKLNIIRPVKRVLPQKYLNNQEEIIDNINEVLEDKINTLINVEYVIYENQREEISSELVQEIMSIL